MQIVDAQLHDPAVWLEWNGADAATRRHLLTELQLAYMASVGVACAVLFPVDLAWAEEAATRLPERFAVVRMITPDGVLNDLDPAAPNIEELVAEERRKPYMAGLRILPAMLPHGGGGIELLRQGLYDRALAACEHEGLPMFMSTMGNLAAPAEVAERYPDLMLIVDHFGLNQPPGRERDRPPFRALPDLLALARYPNVAVKFSGAPALSEEPYPFADVWPHLRQVVDAFGAERLMWASDISRFYGRVGFDTRIGDGEPYPGKHTYAESLHFVRHTDQLTESEKEWILGGTVKKLLRLSFRV